MVHNNKVLTVSYGTFSCTLEGFDDSFGTMKAIAEYFRDLAADDRYFGAEPPQPDVDMLARIAQREIARQVEAHSTDTGGIVLRAAETAAVATTATVVVEALDPTPETTPETTPEPIPEAVSEPTPEPTMEHEVVVVAEAAKPLVGEQVAEPAAQEVILAAPVAVERVAIEPEPVAVAEVETQPDDVSTAPAEADDAFEDVIEAEVVDEAQEFIEDHAEPEEEPEEAVEAVEAVQAETPAPLEDTVAELITPEPETDRAPDIEPAETTLATESVPAADSIAAKLQRIRAVVSQNDMLIQTDGYTEDEDVDGFMAAAVQDITQSLDAEDDLDIDPENQESDDEILQVLTRLDDRSIEQAIENTGDGSGDDTLIDAGGDSNASDDLIAEDVRPEDGDLSDDAGTDDVVGDEFNDEATTSDDFFADEPPVEDVAQFDDPVAVDDEPADARLVKVKRADLEAAIATGQLEQVDDTDKATGAETQIAPNDSSLSPEDEADLMRELAAVAAELENPSDSEEMADNIFGDDIVSEVDDTASQVSTARTNLSKTVGDDEADVSRLMDAADEKLDDPDTSSRRNTYSQLRGAVAAAEAERSAGGSIDGQEQADAYRNDLASVVRPRRPALDGNRASRPNVESRPAPLKLVAEQRVDDGAGITQRGPVRPRRVMTVPVGDTMASDATGADSAFAEFAARMGASELPDLLEAAAAYLSFVEGHDKFSRPQLMNKVRLIQQDDYNREDGLRSFGQLLRDGKIEKRGGGRFAASGEIGFRPDEREAG